MTKSNFLKNNFFFNFYKFFIMSLKRHGDKNHDSKPKFRGRESNDTFNNRRKPKFDKNRKFNDDKKFQKRPKNRP